MATKQQANDNRGRKAARTPKESGPKGAPVTGKALRVNDTSAETAASAQKASTGKGKGLTRKADGGKLKGKSLRVNENTVDDTSSDA